MKKVLIAFNILALCLVCLALVLTWPFGKKHSISHVSKKRNKLTKELSAKYPVTEKKHFVIVIASYNNESVCERNLFSVFDQTYPNYRVIYIDDCSTDTTYEKVSQFVKDRDQEKRVTLIHNDERKLKLANLYKAYMSCKDDEIIVCLDGDDWLAHQNVLKELNHYYQNPDVWLTYGSAINHPHYEKKDGSCLSDTVLKKNLIRDVPFNISMLRTFYAGLFKKIHLKDLLYQGRFLPSADDFAFMIPMIEMAPTHSLFIPEVLYVINDSNPIRESNTIESLQVKLMRYLKTKEKYKPLDVTFNPKNITTLKPKIPIDLIILSNDTSSKLTQSLEEFIPLFSTVTFIKKGELSLKQLAETSSSYIALVTDDFQITEPFMLSDYIQEMELTHATSFFIGLPILYANGIKLKESIYALSLENALKIPELFHQSFFAIFQKQFLLNNLPLKTPHEEFIKTLFLKEKNLNEVTLYRTSGF